MRGLVKTIKYANKSSFQKRQTTTLFGSFNPYQINMTIINLKNDNILTNNKIDNIDQKLTKHINDTNNTFDEIKNKLDIMNKEIAKISILEFKMNMLDKKVDTLDKKVGNKINIIYACMLILLFADEEDKKMLKKFVNNFIPYNR